MHNLEGVSYILGYLCPFQIYSCFKTIPFTILTVPFAILSCYTVSLGSHNFFFQILEKGICGVWGRKKGQGVDLLQILESSKQENFHCLQRTRIQVQSCTF